MDNPYDDIALDSFRAAAEANEDEWDEDTDISEKQKDD